MGLFCSHESDNFTYIYFLFLLHPLFVVLLLLLIVLFVTILEQRFLMVNRVLSRMSVAQDLPF